MFNIFMGVYFIDFYAFSNKSRSELALLADFPTIIGRFDVAYIATYFLNFSELRLKKLDSPLKNCQHISRKPRAKDHISRGNCNLSPLRRFCQRRNHRKQQDNGW